MDDLARLGQSRTGGDLILGVEVPLAFLGEVQQQVLGPKEVLLEYFIGEANSYLWAVTRDRCEFYVLDLTSAEITGYVLMPLGVAAFLIWYARQTANKNWIS